MAAPKGNQFWQLRTEYGTEKVFATPESLWDAACEYFDYCDDHPWMKNEAVKSGELAGTIIEVPTSRPYTLSGLCVFLNIDPKTLNNYGNGESYKDYFPIVSRIKEICYTQKFEGAAVGAFNANLIARELGLKDHVENTGKVVNYNTEVSKDEAKAISDALDDEV